MQLGWEFPRLGFGVMTNSKATAGIVLTRKDERGKYKFWPGRIVLKHVDTFVRECPLNESSIKLDFTILNLNFENHNFN